MFPMPLMPLRLTRRAFTRTTFALTAALGFGAALPAVAQTSPASNPQIYSPVLLGYTQSAATNNFSLPFQARPAGGVASVQMLNVSSHDFSRNPFASGRYFITTEKVIRSVDTLAVYDETGLSRTVLSDPAERLTFWRANWSPSGTRIAWCGGRYDINNPGVLTEAGIYVADVSVDTAGNPAALVNVRQLVSDTNARLNSNAAHVSWTGDQKYIIYRVYTGTGSEIHRIAVDVVGAAAPQRINIGNIASSVSLIAPKASPVAGDGRIAFAAYVKSSELWTVDVPADYNPVTDVLTAKQVTKGGSVDTSFSGSYYDWSPDASAFAFTQAAPSGYPRVMRVLSTGGSASSLLSGNKVGYNVRLWRN